MKKYSFLLFILAAAFTVQSCDELFSSKDDAITDEIFDVGEQDPQAAEDVVGYAALLPSYTGFDAPTDVAVGFDELIYVTDAEGLHVLDRAGNQFRTVPFSGATTVVQDRLLNIYVAARYDTVVAAVDPDIVWNLPAIFKLQGVSSAGNVIFLDTLILPFDDSSLNTFTARTNRLNRESAINYEQVEVTGLATLGDEANSLYVSRRGPSNPGAGSVASPDNTVLEFQPVVENGEFTDKMRNVQQIRALNPTVPSLLSGVGMSDIQTYIGPPQRRSFGNNRSFIVAQEDQDTDIAFRVLLVNAVETTDGLVYQPVTSLLNTDTARADGFLYEIGRFQQPTGLAYAADGRNQIFVVDAASDSLYLFQSNGFEGVNPPPGSNSTKPIIVSFGGLGAGPKQFNNPSGVAYFDQIVFVADMGNNRISRFKLTTDFE